MSIIYFITNKLHNTKHQSYKPHHKTTLHKPAKNQHKNQFVKNS